MRDRAPLLLPADLHDQLARFFEPRAAEVDAGRAPIRPGLEFIEQTVLAQVPGTRNGPASLLWKAQTIATVAGFDMSTAFALWCHQMVVEYLQLAPPQSVLVRQVLPRLLRTELLGSTALAPAMAHYVAGTPLPVTWRRDGADIILDGKIQWASNLDPNGFVQVAAAAGAEGQEPLVIALAQDFPGVQVAPFPSLMALQATQSASLSYQGVRVSDPWVISRQFASFMRRIRPAFLVLQSSFCWGLAHRALAEAEAGLRGVSEIFRSDFAELEARAGRIGAALARHAEPGTGAEGLLDLVQLRLDSAQLATAAVALEVKVTGGRAYVSHQATNRRLREAAFLPIQAPTEGQLRCELARAQERRSQESGVRSQGESSRFLLTPDP